MNRFMVRLPDVGEGVAEAELVTWCVSVGDLIDTETTVAEVLTDKATVDVVSPVEGRVAELVGQPGDVLAVGSTMVIVETGADSEIDDVTPDDAPECVVEIVVVPTADPVRASTRGGRRATAAPAVRARAAALGIDLSSVEGTGPDGRVLHDDLDRMLEGGDLGRRPLRDESTVVPIRGVRRRISDRLTAAWTEIPHITYVDAVDATDLEVLRAALNDGVPHGERRVTMLAFIVRSVVLACRDQPQFNAHYDTGAQELTQFAPVHVGIATQTPDGLMVPVVRHAERLDLWDLADEIVRVSDAARSGSATRDELTGSTITITSLGALGGLVTTPILNRPEVAIVGVNRLETRPVWRDGGVVGRSMFNLSSSFDHRIIDGWDAATFVQRIKSLLDVPSLLFVEPRHRRPS